MRLQPLSMTVFAMLLLAALTIATGTPAMAPLLAGPKAEPSQPSSLTAVHRSGQTFLTWQEQAGAALRYRIYRHDAPIDATNLAQATLLYDGVPQDSGRFYASRYNVDSGGTWTERYTARFVLADNAAPLAAGTGLLVWTLAAEDFDGAQGGNGYYTITSVLDGVENRSDFSSANRTGPVSESVADPLPVTVNASGMAPGGHVYIQYMPLRTWNPTFHAPHVGNGYYGLDETIPAVANAIQYAYDYAVYAPLATDCGGTLPATLPAVVSLHGWAGNNYAPSTADPDPYGWCAYRIYPIDQGETWWFGFARTHDYRTGTTPTSGDSVVNYTEQRVLRMVYDLLRSPPGPAVDPNRVFLFGHSMGGSGTLAMALRYPNVFAATYASEPMTDYATSGDNGGVDWRSDLAPKWGTLASNLPVVIAAPGGWADALQAYNGTGVWTWQNHQVQIGARQAAEFAPLGIAHGTEDNVIEWGTQGRPVYPVLDSSRQAWGGAALPIDHTWASFAGSLDNLAPDAAIRPFANFQPRRDETVPGLSNASSNAPLPPDTPNSFYNLGIRWSASWDPWDGAPEDTTARWAMSLCYKDVDPYAPGCGTGTPLTVDITPRRVQHFPLLAGASYAWENRRVRDDVLIASGVVVAGSDGLVTVPAFALNDPEGNRLILVPTDDFPTVTPTATPTATPSPTPTATRYPCPQATPEPLWVEPVLSPTDKLTQTVVVNIGNGDAVTVSTLSGVFAVTGSFGASASPARVEIDLLAGMTHDLAVLAHVRQTSFGECPYGGYTLGTSYDRDGGELRIVQSGTPVGSTYLPSLQNAVAPARAVATLTPVPPVTMPEAAATPAGAHTSRR